MDKFIKTSKLVFINFWVLFILICTPAFLYSFLKYIRDLKNNIKQIPSSWQAEYPVFQDKKKSRTIFYEFSKVEDKKYSRNNNYYYKSFIEFRRAIQNHKYTNIDPPYHVRRSVNQSLDDSVWFFGGSTIWGTGASNKGTIPSLYAKKTNLKVYNFGESGWTSRHSLNMFMNVLVDNHRPKKVVFYDGVNDIVAGCRRENNIIPASAQEHEIRTILKSGNIQKLFVSFYKWLKSPFNYFASKKLINSKNDFILNGYDCAEKNKSVQIIKNLMQNWYSAYLISESVDADFLAVLQPTRWTSTSPQKYIKDPNSPRVKKSLNYIYPLIQKKINETCIESYPKDFCTKIVDGTSWTNSKKPLYFDFCHISEQGNELVTLGIIKSLQRNYNKDIYHKN